MQKKLIKILYLLLIFSNLYLGGYKIFFGLSIRMPLSIIAIILVLIKSNINFPPKKNMSLILLIPILYFISSSFDINSVFIDFFKDIVISRFFISIIIAIYVYKFVEIITYKFLVRSLIFFLALNSIIIIGQYFNFDFIWNLTVLLAPDRFDIDEIIRVFDKNFVIEGLVGTVYSGYLNVVLIGLILINYNYRPKEHLLNNILIAITLSSSFFLDQRASFYFVIFFIFYHFYNIQKQKNLFFKFFNLLSIIFIFIILIDYFKNLILNSGIFSLEDSNRALLYSHCMNFINDNILLGGYEMFKLKYSGGISPHNLFFNAHIRSGLLGFFVSVCLTYDVLKYLKSSISDLSYRVNYFFKYSSLILFGLWFLSLTHNDGFITGELFTITLYFLIPKLKNFNEINYYN